jgi:uncharacterized membrane protein YdjX (TVP38/TMEM64 family)
LYPEFFTPTYLFDFINKFHGEVLLIYILLSFFRGFFFIPSTPFVIVGGLLFPDELLLVLTISMAGIMFSATVLYYFSDLLGFSTYLDRKFPSKIELWKTRLESSKSIFFIAGWSLIPFVPTDLVCYVTGVMKTSFKNLFLGVFIGELILCSIYIYFGASIFDFIQ